MSEPVIPEQWRVASGSGYIELSQQSYAALGSRIDAAEAKVVEQAATIATFESRVALLQKVFDQQATTIERLEAEVVTYKRIVRNCKPE